MYKEMQRTQTLELTDEQAAALYKSNTKTTFQAEHTVTDGQGNVVAHTVDTSKVIGTEPDYIKVYYRTMLAFIGCDNVPLEFLLAMSAHISYVGRTGQPILFENTRIVRESIQRACGIKVDMYRKYIARCVQNGLIVKRKGYRGVYFVNPFFIAKGKWSDIDDLRTTFDFIKNTWSCHIDELLELNNQAEDKEDKEAAE